MQKKLMTLGLSLLLVGQIQAESESWLESISKFVSEFVDSCCGNILKNKITEAESELENCKTACSTTSAQLASTASQLATVKAYDKSLLARFVLGMGIDKIVRDSANCTGCAKTATSLATQFAVNYVLFDRGILRQHQAQRTWSDAAFFALKASAVYLSSQLANKKIKKYLSSNAQEEISEDVAARVA